MRPSYMRFEQTVAEHTERIRLYHENGRWTWHVEYHWKDGLHPYTEEGTARWQWLARRRAEAALREIGRTLRRL